MDRQGRTAAPQLPVASASMAPTLRVIYTEVEIRFNSDDSVTRRFQGYLPITEKIFEGNCPSLISLNPLKDAVRINNA